MTGLLTKPAEEHRYAIAGKKGENWDIALQARRLGSPLDVTLVVYGPDGKELARNDDLPGTTDAGLVFAAPADGMYQLGVTATLGQRDALTGVYRLVVERAKSGFSLQMPPLVNIPLGTGGALPITVLRM